MKKPINAIPTKSMTTLTEYHWPGNVRELENFIERAVILSPGADLHVPLPELKPLTGNSTDGAKTLEGIEREHILKILRQTNWIIGGRAGAATQLGMQRSTLQSRMKKLGIARPKQSRHFSARLITRHTSFATIAFKPKGAAADYHLLTFLDATCFGTRLGAVM